MRLLALTALTLALASCAPTIANRGNILDDDKLALVKPGATTREEVATQLGTPTQVSTFDNKTWYYVGRQTKQYAFFDPEVIKQKAVEITFDDQGVVKTVQNLDLSEAHYVDTVDRTTPTFGRDDTLIHQLLGSLGHPTTMSQKQEGN